MRPPLSFLHIMLYYNIIIRILYLSSLYNASRRTTAPPRPFVTISSRPLFTRCRPANPAILYFIKYYIFVSTTSLRSSLMWTHPHPHNRKLTVLRVRVSEDPSLLNGYLLVGGLPNITYRDHKNKSNHIPTSANFVPFSPFTNATL